MTGNGLPLPAECKPSRPRSASHPSAPGPRHATVAPERLAPRGSSGSRTGDLAARDELLRVICGRMERLARKMLRQFPDVRPAADTRDVLSGA